MTALELTIVAGTTLLGTVSGVVGTFSVLRHRALVGDLLSHAALPGLCLAFLILGGRHFAGMLAGAFLTGLLGVATISFLARWTRTKEDAAIGIVLSTFFGAGIVLKSMIQRSRTGGSPAGLDSYIYGQAALITGGDVWAIAVVSAVAILLVLLLYKEFKVFSFDPEFARAQGWPTVRLDLLMMGTLAVVTAVGLPAVGVVLMAAMLITPPAAARFWTDRLGWMIFVSGVFGGTSGLIGSLISAGVVERWLFAPEVYGGGTSRSLPAGPVIVLSGSVLFLISMLFAPSRGVIARLVSQLRVRRKTARENLLRALYERTESDLPDLRAVPLAELLADRAWSKRQLRGLIRQLVRRRLATGHSSAVQLTPHGLTIAAEITRKHRLWELFLIEGEILPTDHVDRDADELEHLLPAKLVDQLESDLHQSGSLGGRDKLPTSPHALSGDELRAQQQREESIE